MYLANFLVVSAAIELIADLYSKYMEENKIDYVRLAYDECAFAVNSASLFHCLIEFWPVNTEAFLVNISLYSIPDKGTWTDGFLGIRFDYEHFHVNNPELETTCLNWFQTCLKDLYAKPLS